MYRECGVDGVIVENMHDVPYLRGPVGPHTVSAMTRVGSEVHRLLGGIPLGVQLLSGNNGLASHTSSERELTARLLFAVTELLYSGTSVEGHSYNIVKDT